MARRNERESEEGLVELGKKIEETVEPKELASFIAELLGKAKRLQLSDSCAEAASVCMNAGVQLYQASSDSSQLRFCERVLSSAASLASVGADEITPGLALDGCNRLLSETLTWLGQTHARLGDTRAAKQSLEGAVAAVSHCSVAERSSKLRFVCQLIRAREQDRERYTAAMDRWQRMVTDADRSEDAPVDVATAEAMLASERMTALMEEKKLPEAYEVGKRDLLESVRKASSLSPLRRSDLLPSLGQTHSHLSIVCNRLGDDVSAESHCRAAVWEQAADLGIVKRRGQLRSADIDEEEEEDDEESDTFDLPDVEGVDDQELASSMMTLADFLVFRNQLSEAIETYKRVEHMVRQDAAYRASVLYKLAVTRTKLNDIFSLQRAIECYSLSLMSSEQAHGRKTKERVFTLMYKAQALCTLSRLQEAYDDLDAAFKISREVYGDNHKKTKQILDNLKSLRKRIQSTASPESLEKKPVDAGNVTSNKDGTPQKAKSNTMRMSSQDDIAHTDSIAAENSGGETGNKCNVEETSNHKSLKGGFL